VLIGDGLGGFGVARSFSAATCTQLAVSDLNGDGGPDLIAAGGDITLLFRETCAGGCTYCTAGTTSNGCVPMISGTGTPSASVSSGFTIDVTSVEGLKAGMILYGLSGRNSTVWAPMSTSYLCVRSPVQRTSMLNSGGTFNACDGVLTLDFNNYLFTHSSALGQPLNAGRVIDAQGWFRDQFAPRTSNLSDALEIILAP
jgi:hypothetical protein